ncbi:HEPN domain-containing protein [Candidatus Woesearchaeota archaeon]|nr:HEPN domain-containing protein [Candidatus Woesearchaeota archaeon]
MKEEVKRWWKKAKDDLKKAKILFDNKKYDGSAFFCQQAAEKGLKAVMLKEKNKILKIHDLVELGKRVNLPQNLINYCKELTLAYIYARYPDIEEAKNIKDISAKFLKNTAEILKWTGKKL